MRRGWARRLRWLMPLLVGCKTVTGPPDDALLLNRHPIEGRISTSNTAMIAYQEPTPPMVPWNTRARTDVAEDTTPRRPRVDGSRESRTVPGVLTGGSPPEGAPNR